MCILLINQFFISYFQRIFPISKQLFLIENLFILKVILININSMKMDTEEAKSYGKFNCVSALKHSYTFRSTPTRKKGAGAYNRYIDILKIIN